MFFELNREVGIGARYCSKLRSVDVVNYVIGPVFQAAKFNGSSPVPGIQSVVKKSCCLRMTCVSGTSNRCHTAGRGIGPSTTSSRDRCEATSQFLLASRGQIGLALFSASEGRTNCVPRRRRRRPWTQVNAAVTQFDVIAKNGSCLQSGPLMSSPWIEPETNSLVGSNGHIKVWLVRRSTRCRRGQTPPEIRVLPTVLFRKSRGRNPGAPQRFFWLCVMMSRL